MEDYKMNKYWRSKFSSPDTLELQLFALGKMLHKLAFLLWHILRKVSYLKELLVDLLEDDIHASL